MRAFKRLVVTALLMISISAGGAQAQAQGQTGMAISSPHGPELKSGSLYVITYKCGLPQIPVPKKYLLDDIIAALHGNAQKQTFGFLLHTGAPLLQGTGTISADAAKGFAGADLAYSVDSSAPANSFYNPDCGGSNRDFIVNGNSHPEIIAFNSSAASTDTTKVQSGLAAVTASVNPLFSLLSGAVPLVSVAKNILADGVQAITSYAGLLSLGDSSPGGSVVIPLRVGHFTIGTPIRSIAFDITPVSDLLVAPNVNFRDNISAVVTVDTTTFTAAMSDPGKLFNQCDEIASEWRDAGLTSLLDQSYVLVSAIRKTATKDQLLRCLGRKRALAALPHLNLFGLRDVLHFNLQDVNDLLGDPTVNSKFGQQPQGWPKLGPTAAMLIRDLNRLGNGIALPSSELTAFQNMYVPSLELTDDTFDFSIRHDLFPQSSDTSTTGATIAMVTDLINSGFKAWGCYLETDTDVAFKSDDNEALVLLAWKTAGGKVVPFGVRVLFSNEKIADLTVTDQIDAAALAKKSGCTAPGPLPAASPTN